MPQTICLSACFASLRLLGAIALTSLVFGACQKQAPKPLPGHWQGQLTLQDQRILPFDLEWKNDSLMIVANASERVAFIDIEYSGDSIFIYHPVFEGEFRGVVGQDQIQGQWVKPSLERYVPFKMERTDAPRFTTTDPATEDAGGEWELIFSAHDPQERYIAKGIFNQADQQVTGTIRTTTGDYRFLEGVMDRDTLRLSTFDGAHAFLFEAAVRDSLIYGFFYSGNHWKEPFSGARHPGYKLPDPNSLTYLKEGFDRFDFSFPNEQGLMVSLSDPGYQNKVVVVQIMGTWCPNCLEESKFLANYAREKAHPDLAFVSLAFEYADSEARAWKGINRLKDHLEIPYPILLAQQGSSSKTSANEKLPMLNHIISYPTLLIIDKQGQVQYIHTGFNGEATGEKYTEFVEGFEDTIQAVLNN